MSLILAIACDIEPVPRPPLAIVRRFEQPVDQPFVRQRTLIRDKRRHVIGSRREADQIERRSSNERSLVRLPHRRQASGFELGQDELIERPARPRCVFDSGWGDILHRLERPEPTIFFGDRAARPNATRLARRLGPRQAELNPLPQRGDLTVGQLAVGRHFRPAAMLDCRDQQTFVRLLQRDDRSAFAPGQHSSPIRQTEPTLLLPLRMTRITVLHEEGPYLSLEEFIARHFTCGRLRCGGRVGCEQRTTRCGDHEGQCQQNHSKGWGIHCWVAVRKAGESGGQSRG